MVKNVVTKLDKAEIAEAADGLTDKQIAFVDNLFLPGNTRTDAAIAVV